MNGPDWQTLVNWVGVAFLAMVGWVMKSLYSELKESRREHAELARSLPETYVRRDDFKDALADVKQSLIRIEQKLDGKVDL